MPYANNQGVRIHYEVEGAGPPLVLQHGYTDSLESWYENGYVETLKRDHRLILVDARGHGASDKPHDNGAYAMERRTADIVAVLEALDMPRAHFFGYSMGGWIGFGMAKHAPARLNALVIGGSEPGPRVRASNPLLQPDMIPLGAAGIPAIWDAPLSDALTRRLLANDIAAIRATPVDDPGYQDILPAMAMPCLLFAGEADRVCPPMKAAAAKMPNATFLSFPGLAHAGTLHRADLVLPPLCAFLAKFLA